MSELCGLRMSVGALLLVAGMWPATALAQSAVPGAANATASVGASAPAFEVATIKENKSGSGGSHTNFHNGVYQAINQPLKNLMQYQAYGIPGPCIVGAPKWMDSARFDIEAKMDNGVADRLRALGPEQGLPMLQAMFQQLLADRFKLTAHWETREMPVYALVVAKNGPNLPAAKNPDAGLGTSSGTGRMSAIGATMENIAKTMTQEMSGELGRVVIDRTGLGGKYDIKVKWTPDAGAGGGSDAQAGSAGPSIFTAVQEQLGLRLESAKGPVQVLVIDHLEMPSEN